MISIIFVAIISSIIILYLKSINSELYILASVGAGIIIIGLSLNYLTETFYFINKIIELSGVDKEYFSIIFKITAIGYLVEFSAETIRDMGLNSISEKLIFVGKIIIFFVSLPILYAVLNLIIGLLN